MNKGHVLEQAGSYIILVAIMCAIIQCPEWVIYILFFIGFLLMLLDGLAAQLPLQYIVFFVIPFAALMIHLPVPGYFPALVRIAIIFGFWILMLLLSSYLVLGYTKARENQIQK